jgi:hypothetical protein
LGVDGCPSTHKFDRMKPVTSVQSGYPIYSGDWCFWYSKS